MTAKEWLGRLRKLDKYIDSLIKLKAREYDKALGKGIDISLERVQGGKENSVEDRLLKIAELEYEINRQIDALVEAKCEIIKAISEVENITYRTLLLNYYVNGNTWEQVAENMGYEVRQIYRIHDRALKKIGEALNLS